MQSGGVVVRGREELILGASLRDRVFVLRIEPAQTARDLAPSAFNPLSDRESLRIVGPIAIQIAVAIRICAAPTSAPRLRAHRSETWSLNVATTVSDRTAVQNTRRTLSTEVKSHTRCTFARAAHRTLRVLTTTKRARLTVVELTNS